MAGLCALDSRYDAFLFASICEPDQNNLSVLSLLARQDVDPWQEAARLSNLSKAQAIQSLAATISQSKSGQWSPSEAIVLADRLIDLLPSNGRAYSAAPWAEGGIGGLMLWVAVGLFISIAISGNNVRNSTRDLAEPVNLADKATRADTMMRSSRRIGTD
ncbi:hypothetical protein [Bradyrhizobium vignae]|uniref:hypothetical protein n=1 Tax=Bradyrhizobium vignae TaxID=1549949 RepID=UPI00100B96BB|nr:hypothetical protein [Bradyrhizobium vignae]RXG93220.1 hypothetical protein EAV90_26600 [Bradyrhizobium vignae]